MASRPGSPLMRRRRYRTARLTAIPTWRGWVFLALVAIAWAIGLFFRHL